MTDLNSELSEFERIISRKKWSAILTHQYAEGTYITFHEWNGTRTGRQVFCQVRSCVDVYTAGLAIGEYYAAGQVPMRPPMFWLVEYVPMLTDKRTVLDLKSKLESIEDLEAAHRYIFGA